LYIPACESLPKEKVLLERYLACLEGVEIEEENEELYSIEEEF
jgi:hypothetical protein